MANDIQVVSVNEDHSIELDQEALSKVLCNPKVAGLKVVVLSVAGAFRKGKSFLLDFCIRYLKAETKSDWIGGYDEPLVGFPWEAGSERKTTGILLWSEPIIVKISKSEEVAIILMDTQGAFDSDSTVKECATIFALSSMLSSIQVYNLQSNLQEDNLQHLHLFGEYGRLARQAKSNIKPFQKLIFLIRDWSYPDNYAYGNEGGAAFLQKRMQVKPNQHEELQSLRKNIRSYYENIDCFLMPHPGMKVATNSKYDGNIKDIEPIFVEYLRIFIPQILSSENVNIKKIGGNAITCKDLFFYFKTYVETFKSSNLPEPKSMLDATAEANNLSAVSKAKDKYNHLMEQVCGSSKSYINNKTLSEYHKQIKSTAVKMFIDEPKMGDESFCKKYSDNLNTIIEKQYTIYISNNQAKSIMARGRTAALLVSITIFIYFLSNIFQFVGMYSLASLLQIIALVTLITLCTWSYIRYTGNMSEIGENIDSAMDLVFDQMVKIVYNENPSNITKLTNLATITNEIN